MECQTVSVARCSLPRLPPRSTPTALCIPIASVTGFFARVCKAGDGEALKQRASERLTSLHVDVTEMKINSM